jgi:hypothetical protein
VSKLDELIEADKASETDRICEHHLARTTGQPSLSSLLAHMSRFDDGDPNDVVMCGLHLSGSDYDVLVEAAERIKQAKKKARYS